jgi:uncharacterized protein (UPF0332 family)
VNTENHDLIQYRLKRAKETLDEAHVLISSGYANAAVNRLYYACFYAVLALLKTKNLSSRKHAGVRSLFNSEFVKTGKIEVKWARFFAEIFENRQESDYAEFVQFEQKDVEAMYENAVKFVEMISEKVK